jgi:GT2 family glycosyltransferase
MITNARVSIVVLTYNRVTEVAQTVRRLSCLPEHPPIIVVDNGSTDDTVLVLTRDFPEVQIVQLRENIGAAARNIGVRLAQTSYVALCDDDTWWQPGSLNHAADILAAYPRVAIITGRVLVGPEEREDPTCRIMATSPLYYPSQLPGPLLLGFLAGASLIRRSAFLEVGGFNPRFFLGGEESLVALDLMTAGWLIAYVDSIIIYHHPSAQRDVLARQRLLHRNALWLAWLRRPFYSALCQTACLTRSVGQNPRLLLSLLQALIGLPWVLRNRRIVPPSVESGLRQLESIKQS